MRGQDAVGPMTRVTKADSSEGRCEHWIKPEHQTCVENIGATHTLFLLGGEYFKQGGWRPRRYCTVLYNRSSAQHRLLLAPSATQPCTVPRAVDVCVCL